MSASIIEFIPLISTIIFLLFLTYANFNYYIIPDRAYISLLIHVLSLFLVLWSLFALLKSDPGYVKSYFKFKPINTENIAQGVVV